MVISHHAPAQFKFFTSHESRVTSHEIQLYFSRGRKGSGDLRGLQSRRFGPSRVEWWIRLPHASAKVLLIQLPLRRDRAKKRPLDQGFWTQIGLKFWSEPLRWHNFLGHSFRFRNSALASPSGERERGTGRPCSQFDSGAWHGRNVCRCGLSGWLRREGV